MAERDLELERMMKRELKVRQDKREMDEFVSLSTGLAVVAAIITVLVLNRGMPSTTEAMLAVGLVALALTLIYAIPAMILVGLLKWLTRKAAAS